MASFSTLRRGYIAPSRKHQEPKHLSWQWLARRTTELTDCKDLCFPKKCPKKSFFPRFKKSYIPVDKKSCIPPKKEMSWKEYFSFLLPDPVKKPPLITCRKLQAERRRTCGDPFEYPGFCLNENCCPPPKEWYGQVVVYHVPNPFPEPEPFNKDTPCSYPPPKVPDDDCPITHKELNMEAYAYKRPFSNISVCDPEYSLPSGFKCNVPCRKEPEKNDATPSCFFSEFREPKNIKKTGHNSFTEDLPLVVCKSSEEPEKPKPEEIILDEKKDKCERQSFLKPFRFSIKYPGMSECRKFHTLRNNLNIYLQINQCRTYSTSGDSSGQMGSPFPITSNTSWNSSDNTNERRQQPTYCKWDMDPFTKSPFANKLNEVQYSPNDFNSYPNQNSDESGINPELLKLAEETNKKIQLNMKSREAKNDGPVTLLKQLSDKVNKRVREDTRDVHVNSNVQREYLPQNKFSLCKSNSSYGNSNAKFTTYSVTLAKKKKDKNICSGCAGVREAEEEERNPKPKSFMDCKVRPAGKCRGPTRQLLPGEPEPDNPYQKHRAKPYSLCNKPRIPICKEERGYKLPCETPPKRKFHTTSVRFDSSAPSLSPLYELVKTKGLLKNEKYQKSKTNPWDSHTIESYIEPENSIIEPSSENKGEHIKHEPNKSMHGVYSQKTFPSFGKSEDEWDSATAEMCKNKGMSLPSEKGEKTQLKKQFQKQTSDTRLEFKASDPVSIWDKQTPESDKKKVDSNSGKIPEECSESQNMLQSQRKSPPTGNYGSSQSKPTRLSKLFSPAANESRKSAPFRRDGKDCFNPLEE